MNQKRKGKFWVIEEDANYESRFAEHKDFIDTMEKKGFIKIRTIEGNRFCTPFQDIWTNPEKTHQVYFIHDFVVDTNCIRISRQSEQLKDKPKSISELGSWFIILEDGELCQVADDTLKENDEDEAARAIFNIGLNYHFCHPAAIMMFERYLKSPSVKVRLATIRAIGFQLWNECTPLLENPISSDPNPAVREYASQTLKQIQQPDFDPDDLYENPSNYPHSFERVTEKGLMILPQIKDDLQAWMKEQDYLVMDALVLYQYLVETYGEFKPTDEPIDENQNAESLTNTEDNLEQSTETPEPQQPEITEYEQLQQHLKQDKKQLKQLRSQLQQVETRIEDARRTNIFGRPQSGDNEREQERLTQEIEETKQRIAQNESLLKAQEQ